MDGLIEQMLDGLFRMAEKATGPSKIKKLKNYKIKKPSGSEEGTQPAIVKSEERTVKSEESKTEDFLVFPVGECVPTAKEVPVRKRRRQRVKMVEGTLFE